MLKSKWMRRFPRSGLNKHFPPKMKISPRSYPDAAAAGAAGAAADNASAATVCTYYVIIEGETLFAVNIFENILALNDTGSISLNSLTSTGIVTLFDA